MERDRRSAPRVRVNLKARWVGVHSQNDATITDISRAGCFVLSGGEVAVREIISLGIELPSHLIHFWAEVVDEASEIGFAVTFNSGEEEDRQRLADFIESVFNSPTKRIEE